MNDRVRRKLYSRPAINQRNKGARAFKTHGLISKVWACLSGVVSRAAANKVDCTGKVTKYNTKFKQ